MKRARATKAEWLKHVSVTPEGSVPVRFQNDALAWQVACGPVEHIVEAFRSAAPPEHWPAWALELRPAAVERRQLAARRAAMKNYPLPGVKRGAQP